MGAASVAIPPPPPGFKLDAVPPPPPGFVLDGAPSGPSQDDVADEFARGNAHTLIPGAEDAPAPVRRTASAVAGIPGAITTMARGIPGALAGGITAVVRELAARAFGADPQQARLEGQEAGSAVSAPIIGEPSAQAQQALGIAGKLFDESKLAGLNPAGPVNALQNPGRAVSRELAGHRAMAPIISGAADIASALESARAANAQQAAPTVAILKRAADAGLKRLPTETNPSFKNRILEGIGGKQALAQEISIENAPKANEIAQRHFGVKEPLVPNAFNEGTGKLEGPMLNIRSREVAEGYDPVRKTGAFMHDEQLDQDLNGISSRSKSAAEGFPNATVAKDEVTPLIEGLKQQVYNANSTVDMIGVLREKARTPTDPMRGVYIEAANALEDRLGRHLEEIGRPDMLDRFQKARTTIAQTHDIEPALTPSADVNVQKLATRGKNVNKAPLSGGLRVLTDFARTQEKAMQPVSRIGGVPAISPLDMGTGMISARPIAWAGIAGRPMLRKYLQSEGYQAKNVVPNDFSQPGLVERLARSVAGDKEVPPQIRPDPNAIQFTGADIPSMIAERLRLGERGPAGNEIDFGARERAIAPASRVEAAEAAHGARQADAAHSISFDSAPEHRLAPSVTANSSSAGPTMPYTSKPASVVNAIAERLGLSESPPKKFGNEIDPTEFLRSLRIGKGEAVDEAVVDRAMQAGALKKRFPPASVMNDFQWLMKDK